MPGRKSSGAGRGIFPTSNIAVNNQDGTVIDTTNGVQRLLLADGVTEPWITGTDGLSGNVMVTNKGNYGVIYRVRLAYTSSDGRGLAVLIGAPGRRSGGESRPMAALVVTSESGKEIPLQLTATREAARQRGTLALALKLPATKPGETNHIAFQYSPPGGSSLPTPIYLAPFRQ